MSNGSHEDLRALLNCNYCPRCSTDLHRLEHERTARMATSFETVRKLCKLKKIK